MGITEENDPRGLQIFYAGSFADMDSARRLREEIISRGVKDAFIVSFSGGKRTIVREKASQE